MGQHLFNIAPQSSAPRTKFDRSHFVLTTIDENYLVPIEVDEVVPSDTIICRPKIFGRLSTLIAPIFSPVYIDLFAFYVPERLCFSRFEEMLGDLPPGTVESDLVFPTLGITDTLTSVASGDIYNYISCPSGSRFNKKDNLRAEPYIAYNLIYNEWFRDENLCALAPYNPQLLNHNTADFKLLKRGKQKDYFTSALPWPQKGPDVTLPIGGTGQLTPVFASDARFGQYNNYALTSSDPRLAYISPNGNVTDKVTAPLKQPTSGSTVQASSFGGHDGYTSSLDLSNIIAKGTTVDLSTATAIDVDAFNKAWKLQRFYQRLAIGGSRYVEILRSMFGVTGVDARLQRPELLYSHTYKIDVSAVPQTSSTMQDSTPQGNLAAYSAGYDAGESFQKSIPEHGWIVYIVNLRSDLTYSQGIERQFLRRTKFDMLWPSFSTLGEQPIENRELFFNGDGNALDTEVFGYQERYAEYRYKQSRISGKFSPTDPQSLSFWHLSQKFDGVPKLNQQFIEQDFPFDRVEAVNSEPTAMIRVEFDLQHVRPLPLYGTPALDTHF